MKHFFELSLSGDCVMQFLGECTYEKETAPDLDEGFLIRGAIPAYWEDLIDLFRKNPIHTTLKYNPSYTLQRYPQAGYVPDMALPNIHGCFAYRRSFSIDKDALSERCELFFGGVQNTVSAWINGKYLGRHEGFCSDFSFEFSKDILNDGENELILAVSNILTRGYLGRPVSGCINRAANASVGGIYADIKIRSHSGELDDFYVTVSRDMKSFTAHTLGRCETERTLSLFDGARLIFSGKIPEGESELTVPAETLTPWSIDEPKLYTLELSAPDRTISRKFGLRSLGIAEDGIHLTFNGKPFFFRGICEHGYYPLTVHPPMDKGYFRKNLIKLKSLGFNAIRFHTWVPTEEYLTAADELGFIIEVETPNNTPLSEWAEIVRKARRHTSALLFSSGNEMIIDEEYIEHLREAARLVHEGSDALFSPMSAMRGIEYFSYGDNRVDEPFPHNPTRLAKLSEFCDVYNSYSLGRTSYWSVKGSREILDERNSIYKKPLLSHEIGINGTYIDLSLEERYAGSRIGDTELFSSVREHLRDRGLLDRAPLYYQSSVMWQKLIRKHCFETLRLSESFAGYDFLGDIDHHWHTFGYCVGMMNEFYELKPGETERNVLRYNSAAVLLADLTTKRNFEAGERISVPIFISNYAEEIGSGTLFVTLRDRERVYLRREIKTGAIANGAITKLYTLDARLPRSDKPKALKIAVSFFGENTEIENEWEIYSFPRVRLPRVNKKDLVICETMEEDELLSALSLGKTVLAFGNCHTQSVRTDFQIALAGRTEGHLATLIADHPVMRDFPHDGYCGWQFSGMLSGGSSAVIESTDIPFEPIIEIASSYKYARREALMFEYRVGAGKLFVSTLNLPDDDPGARYLKSRIIEYVSGEEFTPKHELSQKELIGIGKSHTEPVCVIENTNEANNANDVTM